MRRSRLRAGLLVVVAVSLAGIGYQVWRNVAERAPRSLEELGIQLLPQVAQHIRNFRRVKVKSGRMEWEITASDGQYFEARNEVVVRDPEITFYETDGRRRGRLVGSEGRLVLENQGKEIASVVLTGAVGVWIDDLELHTEEANYDRASDRISAAGPVSIKGKAIDVNGVGMEVDVEPQRIRLLAEVRTVLRSDAKPS
ncbi:MAG TPA: LPS export ABC transporter periplasmic protein LptC [Candidatus Binatia bacterium]|jgi:LPS export ABC transporter protein LptC|nr:LPS export ABC transporter periplasmic protein LptC [Candidatus Binatia bacterium]